MIQGTQEWLSWRSKGIGASDSPILLGLSKRTPYELWLEKTGRAEAHSIPTFAKAKGGEIEAQLRARYSLDTGLNFEPACAEHDEFPWLTASYDGIALQDGKLRAIEIKFVGKEIYDAFTEENKAEWANLLKKLKPMHVVQCQHQIMVMDLEYVDYLMSIDGREYKKVRIYPDAKTQRQIFDICEAFYKCLHDDVAPELTEEDWWPATPEIEKMMLEQDREGLKKMPHKKMIGSKFKAQIDKRGALRLTKI